jgi:hypothetical protein
MLKLKYIWDESVQSWIYRNLMVSGCLDFSSVLGTDGCWHRSPHFSDDFSFEKEKLDGTELRDFLRRSGVANKNAKICDNPFDYLDEIKEVFLRTYNINKGKGHIPIRYCEACIADGIKELGFGYFKSSWLFETKCLIHQRKMSSFSTSRKKETEQRMTDVLSGVEIVRKKSYRIESSFLKDIHSVAEPPFHIMPCFLFDFYRWASMARVDGFLGDDYLDFYYVDGRRKRLSNEMLHDKFNFYLKKYPEEMKVFVYNLSEIKEYKLGFSRKCSFTEKLLKSKKYNCSKCYQWFSSGYCPIKPIIIHYLGRIKRMNSQINACDFHIKYKTKYKL